MNLTSSRFGYPCDLNCKRERIYVKSARRVSSRGKLACQLTFYTDHDDKLRITLAFHDDYQEAHRQAIRQAENIAVVIRGLGVG